MSFNSSDVFYHSYAGLSTEVDSQRERQEQASPGVYKTYFLSLAYRTWIVGDWKFQYL